MASIFIFHRDLRLYDQNALQYAINLNLPVLPLFVFTPEQIGKTAIVKSEKAVTCLKQSVYELQQDFMHFFKTHLCVVTGDVMEELSKLIKKFEIKNIVETQDYTPYAKLRQASISEWCETQNIQHHLVEDVYLLAIGSILNKSNKMFQKFTPFYEQAKHRKIPHPEGLIKADKRSFIDFPQEILREPNTHNFAYKGGRKEAEQLLEHLPTNYTKTHDIMNVPTSGLSVHHHNGTISIRETYWATHNEELRRQLFWRDYYANIVNFFEDLYKEHPYTFDGYTKNKLFDFEDELSSLNQEQRKNYENWCNGTTGIDIIDAAMHQINESGYMHNRARLLVSSYLIRDLKLHWRLGERYFATHLLDYDFSQNFCNWIFQASVLPFGRPPFRKDSPVNYQKNFDSDYSYVKRWLK